MSKKKNYPENIQKLKIQLESGNNLIDYFLVCGISPSLCLDENQLYNLTNDKKTNISNLTKILEPKILTKFPEFDNNNDTIDEELINYCFPSGFKPYYYDKGNKIREKLFSIILDNNLFSSENPQKYLTCLLFYEKISQYKSLSDDIQKINNNLDLSGISSVCNESMTFNNNRLSFKNDIKRNNTSMTLPHFKTSSTSLNNLTSVNITSNDTISNNDSTLINLESKTIRLGSINSSKVSKLKYYYIPKCICIVSIHPYIKLFQEILTHIYKYSLSSQQIPIEKIITNLIIEVPIAPRGLYYIDFLLLNKQMTLKRTENNKLLLSDIDLRKFHKKVQLKIQLEVFKHMFFGSKIVFFSNNINDLCETILSFITLIFPFKYPFQITSYLNKNNYNILESISPFIIGINEIYNSHFFDKNNICTEGADIFVVDLDNNITSFISDETVPEFPIKLLNNLEKEIMDINKMLEEEKKNKNNVSQKEYIEDFNHNFQEIYFYFFCELIKNYEEYLNMDYFKNTENDIATCIETLFNCNQFINSHSSSDVPFYTKFVSESQMFVDFIYKRMIPKNSQEMIDILLVNDTLTKIKNKSKLFGKDSTEFANCNKYQRNNRYIVPKPRELTEVEKDFIKKNKENLSEKGQIIRIRTINQNDNISFKYNLFPELDFDIYCNNNNVNEYCLPPDYSEEIEAINIDTISKSSLGDNINRSIEMKNYLYLCWLEVWAFSFWYIDINDKNERHYRFNQMLDVLEKVKHHEINIINMIFDALYKNSENEMILKLYKKILELNINPSAFTYNIISNVIDKAQIRKLKDQKKAVEKVTSKYNYKYIDYNINIIKKRIIISLEDHLKLDAKLNFISEFSCIECGEKINLFNICQTFDNVKNDILWIPCTCGEYNLPKIIVQLGNELSSDDKTSSINEIVLHSPYNLKINIKYAVMNNYGTKLNVLDFKMKFKALFWDFIWYCIVNNLDYTMILPYLEDIQELRRINYRNISNETLEIIFENKLYKHNMKSIFQIPNSFYEKYINSEKKNNNENNVIEKIASFEFNRIIKPNIKLRNINLNEDEDNDNEEKEAKKEKEEKKEKEGKKDEKKKILKNRKVEKFIKNQEENIIKEENNEEEEDINKNKEDKDNNEERKKDENIDIEINKKIGDNKNEEIIKKNKEEKNKNESEKENSININNKINVYNNNNINDKENDDNNEKDIKNNIEVLKDEKIVKNSKKEVNNKNEVNNNKKEENKKKEINNKKEDKNKKEENNKSEVNSENEVNSKKEENNKIELNNKTEEKNKKDVNNANNTKQINNKKDVNSNKKVNNKKEENNIKQINNKNDINNKKEDNNKKEINIVNNTKQINNKKDYNNKKEGNNKKEVNKVNKEVNNNKKEENNKNEVNKVNKEINNNKKEENNKNEVNNNIEVHNNKEVNDKKEFNNKKKDNRKKENNKQELNKVNNKKEENNKQELNKVNNKTEDNNRKEEINKQELNKVNNSNKVNNTKKVNNKKEENNKQKINKVNNTNKKIEKDKVNNEKELNNKNEVNNTEQVYNQNDINGKEKKANESDNKDIKNEKDNSKEIIKENERNKKDNLLRNNQELKENNKNNKFLPLLKNNLINEDSNIDDNQISLNSKTFNINNQKISIRKNIDPNVDFEDS